MHALSRSFVSILMMVCSVSAYDSVEPSQSCTVAEVYNADTVSAACDGRSLRVRVSSTDAPEMCCAGARSASPQTLVCVSCYLNPQGFMAATSVKLAGKDSVMFDRANTTDRSSNGCRNNSNTLRANSGSSSRKSRP